METTISKTWVSTTNEDQRKNGYWSLNASGRGQLVATVSGPHSITQIGTSDVAVVDGQEWALRDFVNMARRGERGLSLVEA